MQFREWNLNEDLLKGIEEAGYGECMPVQEQTLAQTLEHKDVLVQSQTGSGKTAAFVVSVYQLFSQTEEKKKALVIVPTRELAVQIEEEAHLLGKYLPYTAASFYGGVGYANQEKLLEKGVDLLIGTPGRLIDLNESGKLSFHDVDFFIIDEADRLFDMGFLPDIRRIMRKMKSAEERHTMLFSATLNTNVRQVAWEYMNDPADICLSPENITVDGITQELYHVGRTEKINLLIGLLRRENPVCTIIFTNTKQAAYEVSHRLNLNGFKSQYIIGDLPQSKRLKIIDSMKSGNIPVLIATDVAARGLHIEDLQLVVNYDLPEDCENYVHRIGRTARAGKTGKAISLACERYVYGLEAIENYIGSRIPVVWAEDELFAEDASSGKYFNLEKGKHRDPDFREGRDDSSSAGKKSGRSGSGKGKSGAGKKAGAGAPLPAAEKTGSGKKRSGAAASGSGKGKRTAAPKPVRNASLEKRVEYYRKKYGENFSVSKEQLEQDRRNRPSLLQRIKNLFSRKK